jgi:hypothetical protein
MANIINVDDDCLPAEELKLIQTKQAILAKLRVRFGESPGDGWPMMRKVDTATLADKRSAQSRIG